MDIVKLYNPANSASLSAEDTANLQKLTSEQIKELAKAYPNSDAGGYLLIIDTSIKNPLPQLSSFQNLWNLRERNGLRKMVAFNFKANYKPRPVSTKSVKAKRSEVLDLSDTELLTLPGFKTKDHVEPPSEVVVTKVRN